VGDNDFTACEFHVGEKAFVAADKTTGDQGVGKLHYETFGERSLTVTAFYDGTISQARVRFMLCRKFIEQQGFNSNLSGDVEL
jgi:hypothetical protein